MGCPVQGQVKPEREMAGPCPCHYTTFDLSKGGLVVSGAATTDLPQIRLDVEDGDVYATGVDGLSYGYRDNLRDGEPVTAEETEG
ncbi:arsenite oxidase small subunit AoxA [Halorubrum sp. AJ67]|nr:arsenite oxidase small subunit AoxA [Halorubrum sp. AJ67]